MSFGRRDAEGSPIEFPQNCEQCKREPDFKEIWGCEGETARTPIVYEIGGVEYVTRRCPVALLEGTGIHEVLDAYWWTEKGIAPVSGGLEAQSCTFVDAVAIIRNLVDKHERQQSAGSGGDGKE